MRPLGIIPLDPHIRITLYFGGLAIEFLAKGDLVEFVKYRPVPTVNQFLLHPRRFYPLTGLETEPADPLVPGRVVDCHRCVEPS